jgi:ribosomal protein S18 acetylase RimI-like enzyme
MSETTVLIRDAAAADAEAIGELIAALRAEGSTMPPKAPSAEYVVSYLDSGADVVLVAESDGRVVGLVTMSVNRDLYHEGACAFVKELVVAEGMRRRGVGSALLDAAIERARDRECAEISLTTALDNERAQALYRGRGLTMEALHLERHFDE